MWKGVLAAGLILWPLTCLLLFFVFLGCFLGTVFLGGIGITAGLFFYGAYAIFRDSGWLDILLQKWQVWRDEIYEHLHTNVESSFPVHGDFEKIPKDRAVLYVCHPHGLFSMTWFFHFGTHLTRWPSDLRKPKIAVHSFLFRVPLVREFIRTSGGIEATEEAISQALRSGESVAIVLGGIEEILESDTKVMRLVVEKRKGYARIAKKMDAPLVPLIALGENELFPLVRSPWLNGFQSWARSWFSIVFPIPTWKSFRSWFQLAHQPLEKPVETWCLEPVFPGRGVGVEKLREQYLGRLREFAEEHKGRIEIVG